ncbi:MAG: hypothetical protein NZM25_00940 [Leptospiraceae bacterium]|nr:hypothetical protein [Leptospiraceae bacterium]MDW8306289.1 hypothetical protein [Leptospiraceae bacterium]
MKLFIFFSLGLLTLYCQKSKEALLEKAKEELGRENVSEALQYIREAYELSLPNEFFFRPRHEKYELIVSLREPNKIFALKEDKKSLYIYDTEGGKEGKLRLPYIPEKMSFSPRGNYLIFSYLSDDSCLMRVYSFLKEKFYKLPQKISCGMVPGISEEGLVPLVENEKLVLYQITGELVYTSGKKLEKGGKLPAESAFFFDYEDHLYFTYGLAGLYYLYYLEKDSLKLLRRDVALPKAFAHGRLMGFLTGGAGSYEVVFFEKGKAQIERFSAVSGYAAFLQGEQNHYYYLRRLQPFEVKGADKRELPFWARDIALSADNKLLLLSPLGSILKYSGKLPPEVSLAIFQKGVEIEEGR